MADGRWQLTMYRPTAQVAPMPVLLRRLVACGLATAVGFSSPTSGRAQAASSRTAGAERGAAIGGILGAAILGSLGALLAQGICDKADCSDSWQEGAGPSWVLGSAAGGVLGALLGAALPPRALAAPAPEGHPALTMTLGPVIAGAIYQSDVTNLPGLRVAAGAHGTRLGGELEFEHHRRSEWRGTGVTGSAVLTLGAGRVRSQWRVGVARFAWTNPGDVPLNDPQFPGAYVPGTVRDDYVTPVLGFGLAAGTRGAWSLVAEGRWHHHTDQGGDFYSERSLNTLQLGLSYRRRRPSS